MNRATDLLRWCGPPAGMVTLACIALVLAAHSLSLLDGYQIRAFSNMVWSGNALIVSYLAHRALQRPEQLTAAARITCAGVRISGVCVALHGAWRTAGIYLREPAIYTPWAVEYSIIPVLLVTGIAYGAHRAIGPYLRAMMPGPWPALGELIVCVFSALAMWPAAARGWEFV